MRSNCDAPRPPDSRHTLAAACALIAAVACTQPSFPNPDAGATTENDPPDLAPHLVSNTAPDDADVPAAPPGIDAGTPLPPEAVKLAGRYARRSTFFEVDGTSVNPLYARGVEFALLDFGPDGSGGFALDTEICDVRVENQLGIEIHLPAFAPGQSMRQAVSFGPDGAFRTVLKSVVIGYDPDRFDAPGCEANGSGARRKRFADQVWSVDEGHYQDGRAWNNDGTCACAVLRESPPMSPTDCRINDPDGDKLPGITAYSTAPLVVGTIPWSMTLEVGSAFDDGTIDAAGRIAVRERRALRVGCVNRAVDACQVSNGSPCVASTTQTMFIRLGTSSLPNTMNCDDLRSNADAVFAQGLPDYPASACL